MVIWLSWISWLSWLSGYYGYLGYHGYFVIMDILVIMVIRLLWISWLLWLRTFLDYYGIEYTKVEVHPVFKREIGFSDYKKVPIVIVDDEIQVLRYFVS